MNTEDTAPKLDQAVEAQPGEYWVKPSQNGRGPEYTMRTMMAKHHRDLYARLKIRCFELGKPVQEGLFEAVSDWLNKEE